MMRAGLVKAGSLCCCAAIVPNHPAVEEYPGWALRRRCTTFPVVGV